MIQSEKQKKKLKWVDSQRIIVSYDATLPLIAVYLKRIVQGSTVHKWSYSAIKRIEVLIYTMAMDEFWKHVQTKTWIFMVTLFIMAKRGNKYPTWLNKQM